MVANSAMNAIAANAGLESAIRDPDRTSFSPA